MYRNRPQNVIWWRTYATWAFMHSPSPFPSPTFFVSLIDSRFLSSNNSNKKKMDCIVTYSAFHSFFYWPFFQWEYYCSKFFREKKGRAQFSEAKKQTTAKRRSMVELVGSTCTVILIGRETGNSTHSISKYKKMLTANPMFNSCRILSNSHYSLCVSCFPLSPPYFRL